jgi:hypothetical protein
MINVVTATVLTVSLKIEYGEYLQRNTHDANFVNYASLYNDI